MESLHEEYPHWTFTAESIMKKKKDVEEKMELE